MKKHPLLGVHCPAEIIDRLKAVAKAEDRPVSSVVRRALRQYLAFTSADTEDAR